MRCKNMLLQFVVFIFVFALPTMLVGQTELTQGHTTTGKVLELGS